MRQALICYNLKNCQLQLNPTNDKKDEISDITTHFSAKPVFYSILEVDSEKTVQKVRDEVTEIIKSNGLEPSEMFVTFLSDDESERTILGVT